MQKTKLGIPFGFLASGIYFAALFGGYLPVILLTAYVLLVEDDEWIRRSSVKALILLILFSLIDVALGFIPDVLNVLNGLINLFGDSFTYSTLSSVLNIIGNIFHIIEYVLFIVLGFKALRRRSLIVPIVDKTIYRYMG